MAFTISIRTRLFVILIVIFGGLFLQFLIQTNYITVTSELDQQSNMYFDIDQSLISEVSNVSIQSEFLIRSISENIASVLLNHEKFNISNADMFLDFKTQLNNLIKTVQNRNNLNYNFSNVSSNILLSSDDISLMNNFTEIISSDDDLVITLNTLDAILNSGFEFTLIDSDLAIQNYLNGVILIDNINENVNTANLNFTQTFHKLIDSIVESTNNTYKALTFEDSVHIQTLYSDVMYNFSSLLSKWNTAIYKVNNSTDLLNIENQITLFSNGKDITYSQIYASVNKLFDTLNSVDKILLLNTNNTIIDVGQSLDQYISQMNQQIKVMKKLSSLGPNELDFYLNLISETLNNVYITISHQAQLFKQYFIELKNSLNNRMAKETKYIAYLVIILSIIVIIPTGMRITQGLHILRKMMLEISDGKFKSVKNKKYKDDEFGEIEKGLDTMVTKLRSLIIEVLQSSNRLAGISEMLAAGTQEASASISTVSNTINDINVGANQQNMLLTDVLDRLEKHLNQVRNASVQIEETAQFVMSVSQKTNMLGLNASIEAAKAGTYGKGFNIVAKEVRTLAQDSKKSAKRIAELIETINLNLKSDVESLLNQTRTIKSVAESTSSGSYEANQSTSEQVIMLGEISQTSTELSELAAKMDRLLNEFSL